MHWQLPERVLTITQRPLIMAIVNVTPDSFSDGGRLASADDAVAHGLELVRQGADILDIGGESTRPGSQPVSEEEELHRVLPVIAALRKQVALPLSVDTSKAEVARQCLAAGAQIINDVTALAGDLLMAEVVRAANAGVILMHMRGTPASMQIEPRYDDVVSEVISFLQQRLNLLTERGIGFERFAVDPGIGFGKTSEHNLQLLGRLAEMRKLGRPVCLGVSRKGFIGKLTGEPVERRIIGSVAALALPVLQGAAQIVRVHDVQATREAVDLWSALAPARGTDP
jgi:dihydropteroate synthase